MDGIDFKVFCPYEFILAKVLKKLEASAFESCTLKDGPLVRTIVLKEGLYDYDLSVPEFYRKQLLESEFRNFEISFSRDEVTQDFTVSYKGVLVTNTLPVEPLHGGNGWYKEQRVTFPESLKTLNTTADADYPSNGIMIRPFYNFEVTIFNTRKIEILGPSPVVNSRLIAVMDTDAGKVVYGTYSKTPVSDHSGSMPVVANSDYILAEEQSALPVRQGGKESSFVFGQHMLTPTGDEFDYTDVLLMLKALSVAEFNQESLDPVELEDNGRIKHSDRIRLEKYVEGSSFASYIDLIYRAVYDNLFLYHNKYTVTIANKGFNSACFGLAVAASLALNYAQGKISAVLSILPELLRSGICRVADGSFEGTGPYEGSKNLQLPYFTKDLQVTRSSSDSDIEYAVVPVNKDFSADLPNHYVVAKVGAGDKPLVCAYDPNRRSPIPAGAPLKAFVKTWTPIWFTAGDKSKQIALVRGGNSERRSV